MTQSVIAHYINGRKVAPEGGRRQAVFNPATGEVSAEVALAGIAEVEAAVAAAQAAIDAGNTDIADPAQRWGNPDSEGARVFVNAEHEGENVTLYAFGNYAHTTAESTQFWRNPSPTGPRRDVFASVRGGAAWARPRAAQADSCAAWVSSRAASAECRAA